MLVIFIGVCIMLTITSCAQMGFGDETVFSGNSGYACAWCKARIDQYYQIKHSHSPLALDGVKDHYETYRGSGADMVCIYQGASYDQATAVIRNDGKNIPGVIVREGLPFCSLRCVNAYEASKGIKEERKRIIQGE
jgi:hypothetical protein